MRFEKWKKPAIKHRKLTKWLWVVWYPKKLKMGNRVDIGAFTSIFAHYGVIVEDDVQIGSHVSIYTLNTEDNIHGKVIIRKRARIGTHATIMPGVEVGEDAIVAAYSFVKENVPPRTLVAGIPATVRKRL